MQRIQAERKEHEQDSLFLENGPEHQNRLCIGYVINGSDAVTLEDNFFTVFTNSSSKRSGLSSTVAH